PPGSPPFPYTTLFRSRVVFYDYDELCFLTDCNFRDLPQASTYEEEISAEPWFSVRENDVFPEEFLNFLRLPGPARTALLEQHARSEEHTSELQSLAYL